jgi:hypothetical protein
MPSALLKVRSLCQDVYNDRRLPMTQKVSIGPITKVVKTDDEWKKLLAPDAYQVLRHEGT